MEKYKVLGKYYEVAEQLRKEKQENHGAGDLSMCAKLPSSAKRMLGLLLIEDNVNQRTIAKALKISSQAVSEAVKKLESNDLVTKVSGTVNNENLIVLTREGRNVAIDLDEKIKAHAEAVFEDFTQKEVDMLYTLLDKIGKFNEGNF